MPNLPHDDQEPLPPEVQTALDAREEGERNIPDLAPHPKLAELRAAFDALPDVRQLRELLHAAMNDTSDPVPVTITVKPRLLQLLAHVERLDAAATGRAPEPVSAELSRRVYNELDLMLDGLSAVHPTVHPYYAKVWNDLCAAKGAPELAIPKEAPETGKDWVF
ncbi:hypothetical protein MWN34_19410 [Ancylobacter sp. 6x-1]|uniref:Uncharacterized protein n=1 Tax=Ancylobacter crimeensis TaxID=2579147 RepID=A0ABT0DGI6_9HYPH|nr:hypothetical protein [Ancylobacter crimeensis]MCK0199072.1 hypothetical protein [Ancylobacter crimeensis]